MDFPIAGTPAEQLRFLLHYAVLAPSGHNSQPWLFKIDAGAS
jgi:nitroreductase